MRGGINNNMVRARLALARTETKDGKGKAGPCPNRDKIWHRGKAGPCPDIGILSIYRDARDGPFVTGK